MLVGDVVGDASLATGLSPGSSWLEVKLLTPGLESRQTLLGPAWQVHVDAGPHAGAKVGGAGVKVAVLGVQHEVLARLGLDRVLDSLDALGTGPALHGARY